MSDRSCVTAKRGFPDQAAIDVWLAEYRRTKQRHEPRMKSYPCRLCGSFHLTKWQQWTPRKVRRKKGVAW